MSDTLSHTQAVQAAHLYLADPRGARDLEAERVILALLDALDATRTPAPAPSTSRRRPVRDVVCTPEREHDVRIMFADAIEDGVEVRVDPTLVSEQGFVFVDKPDAHL